MRQRRGGIRQQAGLPRLFYKAAVGSLLASECANAEGREFASKLVSHGFSTRPLWEACLQANVPTPKGENSPASWSPTAFLQGRCGKLACKRMRQRRGGIRQQAGLPRLFYKAAVGSLLASECANAEGREFASKLVSHGFSTRPLWEACLQANVPTPKGESSPASWSPTAFLQGRCGKLACKRMCQRRRARIRQQAGLPRITINTQQ